MLECVNEFTYLGNLVTKNNYCGAETNGRIDLSTSQRMGMLKAAQSG